MPEEDAGARTPTGSNDVVRYLAEARKIEEILVRALREHASSTPAGDYQRVLKRHLRVTERHRDAVDGRLAELGGGRSAVAAGLAALESIAERVVGIVTSPLSVLRSQPTDEVLLTNARGEIAAEAWEIATYRALEILAKQAGDGKTARMAARIRADEERMLAELHELIPDLATAVATAEVSKPSAVTEPWPGYDQQNAAEINRRLSKADDKLARAVRDYEGRHNKRATILRRARAKA